MDQQTSVASYDELWQQINDLYLYRDTFFLNFDSDRFDTKDDEIATRSNKILVDIEKQIENASKEQKPKFLYLKGWLLNIREQFDQRALQSLMQAAKLAPTLMEVWLELGECYYKNAVPAMAQNCLEKVIQAQPNNKRALRNLSIVLRSVSGTAENKKKNIVTSLQLAQKAVEIDLSDGESWTILGNAYAYHIFMGVEKDREMLRKCKKAYQKALLDDRVRTRSDLHFSYSAILQLEEDFQKQIEHLNLALKYEPSWKEVEEKRSALAAFFDEIIQGLNADFKVKKVKNLLDKLRSEEEKIRLRQKKNQELMNGDIKPVFDLVEGENQCLFTAKVIQEIPDAKRVFLCPVYVVLDSNEQSITLFVYNLDSNQGPKPGDLLTVIRPVLRHHSLTIDSRQFEFPSIRIETPWNSLMVNNTKLPPKAFSYLAYSTQNTPSTS